MRRGEFEGILPFLAVVEAGSFRAAADQLGVTPSAVSQAVKALEARLGVPLLTRTTRSLGLTEAGAQFAARCRPAMAEIGDAVEGVKQFGDAPSGLLRLNAPRIAWPVVFAPIIEAFRQAYPQVDVEVFLDDGIADIAADGFDAGIRLGQMVQEDMVSRALTPSSRMAVVASPRYLERHGTPQRPADLSGHACLNFRRPTRRTLYQWRFVVDGRDLRLPVEGGYVFNDSAAKLDAARAGLGLAYEIEPVVRADVRAGHLVHVLEPFLPEIPGFHIYFPSRAQMMLKLRAFIDFAVKELKVVQKAGV